MILTKLSQRQYCCRIPENFHSQEYIQFFDVNGRLYASALPHWLLLLLLGFWRPSLSPILRNSNLSCWSCASRVRVYHRFSFLRFNFRWWRETPLFRRWEEWCFIFSFNFRILFPLASGYFWPASTLLREHIALAIPSLPETGPQILERWGCADENPWENFIERWILVSDFEFAQYGFGESNRSGSSPHGWALPWNRWIFRRLHILFYNPNSSSLSTWSLHFCYHFF